ncbi:geranylgeranyl transferase type-2 subunit alpha [Uranotaenia lowii]|uniref:geranylgeranyl transferase type-2 subunit alpha n=1 Tax=Uranotaenia lowii TaxID=190385 RepID=UPI00247969B2|nr:geranylgeranyl transferase type-2 subunit alpha [Uranotaenia lowii]
MHGRLKVRTSAEEALRKKKEREVKAQAFRAGMGRILQKKQALELDQEMMDLTGKILGANPDIATLWNLRRMCIEQFVQDEKDQALFDKDLGFTELCLQVNPKSYCAWHHRCWILENAPEPNWKREVDLCGHYLKLDERNFHCWDYRRYVAEKAQIAPKDELDFCTDKIQNNFSNYSSWHYRSKLLPILFPNQDDPSRPISEAKLKEELELVLTAAFTDPNDSSAWFYQRWLLGNSQPPLDIVAFRMDLQRQLAVITFSRPVNLNHENVKLAASFSKDISEVAVWKAPLEKSYSLTWILNKFSAEKSSQDSLTITFTDEDSTVHTIQVKQIDDSTIFGIKQPKFDYEFGSAVVTVLKTQLESCEQLLEFEPDSKWTLLTAAMLMKAIDRVQFYPQMISNLEKLQTVDPLRKGYYSDILQKWSIENRLVEWTARLQDQPNAALDLSGLGLTHLAFEQYLAIADELDLSGNALTETSLIKFKNFVFCRKLSMLDNSQALANDTEAAIRKFCKSLSELQYGP